MEKLGKFERIGVAAAIAAALLIPTLSQGEIQVGFGTLTAQESPAPVATALFSLFNSEGVLLSEAGVAAVEPINRGRIFVDERTAAGGALATGVALANPSSESVVADLSLRNSDGAEIETTTAEIPAGQQLPIFVNQLFPDTPLNDFSGSLTFTCPEGRALAAVTIRQTTQTRDGNVEALFATLPVADLSPGAETLGAQIGSLVFPHLGAGSGISTQLILINRSGNPASGTIRLTASSGEPLALEVDGEQTSQFAYQLSGDGVFRTDLTLASGLVSGYAVLTPDPGTELPSGTAIFQLQVAAGLASEAGVGAIAPTRQARVFVDTADTQTGIAAANFGNDALEVTVRLLDRNGFAIEAVEPTTVELPANGHFAVFADQIFTALPPHFTGLMELSSPEPIVPITLKLSVNARSELILTTLPIADLTSPSQAVQVVFPQLGFGSIFSTRLILINADVGSPASGELEFFASAGGPLTVPLAGETDSRFDYGLNSGGGVQLQPGNSADLAEILLDPFDPAQLELTLAAGDVIHLNPQLIDSRGNPRDDFSLEYASIEPDVASVDDRGTLTANEAGFSTLIVAGRGVVEAITVSVVEVASGAGGLEIAGVAQDLSQRLYLANAVDNTILLSEALEEAPETYAGQTGTAGLIDAARLESLFDEPAFLAYNGADGSLLVSDTRNHAIRLVHVGEEGQVETVAGTGSPGSRDGAVAQAEFNSPRGLALDREGQLWVADSGNHTIRRIDLVAGTATTIAGQAGDSGFSDGQGSDARFNTPIGIAVEVESLALQLERVFSGGDPPPVSVLVADSGNGVIRRVLADGAVTTVGQNAVAPSQPGFDLQPAPGIPRFEAPEGLASDSFGNIYVTEPEAGRVQVLLPDGNVIPLTRSGSFSRPRGIVVGNDGQLVVADGARTAQQVTLGEPEIFRIEPQEINSEGGDEVVIRGRNFAPGTQALAGAIRLELVRVNSNELRFTSPKLPSGLLTLTLLNRGGAAQSVLRVAPVRLQDLPPQAITTLAGGTSFGGEGLQAANVILTPRDVILDSAGNLYIADIANNRVRKVDRGSGTLTTVAGNGNFDFVGDGGLAILAGLQAPSALAFDRSGGLLIAEGKGHRIRRVGPDGRITTLAGNGRPGFSGDGGPAERARIANPGGLALDAAGAIYFADSGNNRIRRIDAASGIIQTVIGPPQQQGPTGDAPIVEARLNNPKGLAFDENGNLYIADTENRLVRILRPDGTLERAAGNGRSGLPRDGVPADQSPLEAPFDVAVNAKGIFIADAGHHRIRTVDRNTGLINTLLGTEEGFSPDGTEVAQARLSEPTALLIDDAGGLTVAETGNNRVRRVSPRKRQLVTLAGRGAEQALGDNGSPEFAVFDRPTALAEDADGNVYVSDTGHHRIRKVNLATQRVTTAAGNGEPEFAGDGGPAVEASLASPADIVFDAEGRLLIADLGNRRVRLIDRDGIISTVAGTGGVGPPMENVPATEAPLIVPRGLAVTADGDIYVSDAGSHLIRRIDAATGFVFTAVGTGEKGFQPAPAPALEMALDSPADLAVDRDGNLLIADQGNHRVLRLDLSSGLVTGVAGTGERGFAGDGEPALEARLDFPGYLSVLANGDILVSDRDNNRIRRISAAAGVITTTAGSGRSIPLGDGEPATEAALKQPRGLLSKSGNLLIVDWFRSRVRAVRDGG